MKRFVAILIIASCFGIAWAAPAFAQTFLCYVEGGSMECRLFDVEWDTTPAPPPTWTPYPVPTNTPTIEPTPIPTATTATTTATMRPVYAPSKAHADLFLTNLFREFGVLIRQWLDGLAPAYQ